jgi:hypothetical protein
MESSMGAHRGEGAQVEIAVGEDGSRHTKGAGSWQTFELDERLARPGSVEEEGENVEEDRLCNGCRTRRLLETGPGSSRDSEESVDFSSAQTQPKRFNGLTVQKDPLQQPGYASRIAQQQAKRQRPARREFGTVYTVQSDTASNRRWSDCRGRRRRRMHDKEASPL